MAISKQEDTAMIETTLIQDICAIVAIGAFIVVIRIWGVALI
jgi:hypothetical protein